MRHSFRVSRSGDMRQCIEARRRAGCNYPHLGREPTYTAFPIPFPIRRARWPDHRISSRKRSAAKKTRRSALSRSSSRKRPAKRAQNLQRRRKPVAAIRSKGNCLAGAAHARPAKRDIAAWPATSSVRDRRPAPISLPQFFRWTCSAQLVRLLCPLRNGKAVALRSGDRKMS